MSLLNLSSIILAVFTLKLTSREILIPRLVVILVCLCHHFEGSHTQSVAGLGILPQSKVYYLNTIYTKSTEYNMMRVASEIYVYLRVFASV